MGIKLPFPHIGQQTVRREMRRINWMACGRRWRKTTLKMTIAVEAAYAGQHILWGAPTYDQVRIGWMEARRAAHGVADFAQTRMIAEFPNNGRIIYRSLDDPDNARGHTADGVVVDEAGMVKAAAWFEVLRPMLMDTDGWALLGGTPNGRNWFFAEHVRARDDPKAMAWQIPTVGAEIIDGQLIRKPHPLENPFIPFEEIERLWQTLPERTFRQEILAEFIEGEGAVFRNIAANLYPGGDTPADHARHDIIFGVDWGKQSDYTAISAVCLKCQREVALDRFNQIDYRVQRQRLGAMYERWHAYNIIAESNAMGAPIIEQLQYDGLPVTSFETTASSKPQIIESLALALEREECKWLDIAIATAELEAYERTVSANTGRSRYSAPMGVHDDTVMARALSNYGRVQLAGPWITVI